MCRNVRFLILALVGAAAAIASRAPSDSAAQDRKLRGPNFTGVPRDIDFIKNTGWTQVILHGKADELVAQTKNDRIQTILLVALSLKSQVTVEYVEDSPKKLTSVSLPVKAKEEQGYVLALSADEKDYCRATVFDQSKKVNVWTKDAQMQSILETAVRQSIPVQEFVFDSATKEITRGKVNVQLVTTRTPSYFCPLIPMMEWNGLWYYDSSAKELNADDCAGTHMMVSTSRYHEPGCVTGACNDKIIFGARLKGSDEGKNMGLRKKYDKRPTISNSMQCRGKGEDKGKCKKFPEGRVHFLDKNASIDNDVHVKVTYKSDAYYFRVLEVSVKGLDDPYIFAQQLENAPGTDDEPLYDDAAGFVGAKKDDIEVTIKYKGGKTTSVADDMKHAILLEKLPK